MAFLTAQELAAIGFKSLGNGVLISDKASIYGAQYISIGDNSRIDDFCILSAGVGGFFIGRYVHISCYASLIGQGKILIEDFVNISGRTAVYSSSDDFSGVAMIGPLVGAAYTNVLHAPVHIGRHTVVGAGSIVLPGISIGEGVSVGAMSLVLRDCPAMGIYAGTPAVFLKPRQTNFLELEKQFMAKANVAT